MVIGALSLVALSALPRLEAPALPSVRVSGHTVARESTDADLAARPRVELVADRAIAAGAAAQPGSSGSSITGDVVDAAQRFNFVGVHWRVAPAASANISVEVRASSDGATWSEWYPVT